MLYIYIYIYTHTHIYIGTTVFPVPSKGLELTRNGYVFTGEMNNGGNHYILTSSTTKTGAASPSGSGVFFSLLYSI